MANRNMYKFYAFCMRKGLNFMRKLGYLLLATAMILTAALAAQAQNIPPQSGEAYHELIERHNRHGVSDGTDWESKIPRSAAAGYGAGRAEGIEDLFGPLAALLHSAYWNGFMDGGLRLVEVNPQALAAYFGGDISRVSAGACTFVGENCYMTVGQLRGILPVINGTGTNLTDAVRSLLTPEPNAPQPGPGNEADGTAWF